MIKIKLLNPKNINGKNRPMALWKCMKCGIEKERRADAIQTTEFCSSCAKITHGHGYKKIYNVWCNMKARCYNPRNSRYSSYGARGITVCQEWLIAENFISWAYDNGYKEKAIRNTNFTIDRIDNNKDYSPENCRIVPLEIQHYNKQLLSVKNKSGYRGVHKKGNKYIASIVYNGKNVLYKYFDTAKEAAIQRDIFIVQNNLPHILNWYTLKGISNNASLEEINNTINELKGD